MDDIFSDAGIRSRLNRMPFGFGSRKRVNDPNRYFNDDSDFFPHFGTLGRRRHPNPDRSGVFEHIPPEFKQYIPEGFDLPQTVRNTPSSPRTTGTGSQPQYPSQYYDNYGQTSSGNPKTAQPQAPQKPKLCDAAIQTEFPSNIETEEPCKSCKSQPLKQHGLRNTVDLGQKSPSENESSPRAQSAPPNDSFEQSASGISTSANSDNSGTSSTAYAYVPPPEQKRWQPHESNSPQSQQKPQIPPSPRSQSNHPLQQPQSQQQSDSQHHGGPFVRTVPIFVEGHPEPVINTQEHTQAETQSQQQQNQFPPQYQSHKQFHPQKPQQYQPYQQCQYDQQQQRSQERPTPLNTEQANKASSQQSPVPNTPQTTETIGKIQLIQRDVLDLMSKVEKFSGMKNDKEYMYLDEMLTRNLLKLDTIDTQGKERIRLARKEAIKCIQASINVLEAKAEENAKAAQKSMMKHSQEISVNSESQNNTTTNENNLDSTVPIIVDEINTTKLPDVVPLPAPPEWLPKENQNPQDNQDEQNNIKAEEQNVDPTAENNIEKISDKSEMEKNSSAEAKDDSVISVDVENLNDKTVVAETQGNKQSDKLKSEDQQASAKEGLKDSPKKKAVKKIVKKLNKKDNKKEPISPPSEEQDIENMSALEAPTK